MKQPLNRHDQQGATLIVVLLVLLLIMIAGAMAVRQSRTDLQVATSDQINTVLLQTADNANQKLEQVINGAISDESYKNLVTDASGFIGYFYSRDDRADDEVIYCQTGDEQTYLVSGATIRKGSGGTTFNNGYCASGTNLKYTSNRGTMVGQVSISPSVGSNSDDDDDILGSYTTGTDISTKTAKRVKFDIHSTAAIPAYSGGSEATTCFKDHTGKPTTQSDGTQDYTNTVSGCLEKAGVPQTNVYQQADISQYTTAKSCVNFGTAQGDADKDSNVKKVCQLN